MDKNKQGYAAPTIAQQHSDALVELIKHTIVEQGGWIDFAQYMQLCLYTPGLGYYSAGSHKIGAGGDFTTAPEMTPLFGQSLAKHIEDVAAQLGDYDVLEFGAGTGKLAADILQQLAKDACLPRDYFIVEVSAELRDRQRTYLQQHCPSLVDRIHWLEALPENFHGVMLANEVCDAMPVHRVHFTENNAFEQGIAIEEGSLVWTEQPSHPALTTAIDKIRHLTSTTNYHTEIHLAASDWLQTLAQHITQGALFIIDYGYDAAQYYQPDRLEGTLRCYSQQQASDDPLLRPGLQDITAHVNFTALAETALASGLAVASYQEQGDFLLAGGITELAQALQDETEEGSWLQHSAALKQLLLPSAMGHQFKVLSLTKAIDLLPRLMLGDRRYQL